MSAKLIISLMISVVAAFASAEEPTSGAPLELTLTGDKPADNFKRGCGFHNAITSAKDPEAFVKALDEVNFDPCCLGADLLDGLSMNKEVVNGVSIGYMTSIPLYEAGKELVMFYNPREGALSVAVFHYYGAAMEVELPVGMAISHAILYGACNTPQDYEGYFRMVGLAGMTVSLGMSSTFVDTPKTSGLSGLVERISNHIGAQQTGCNSVGLNSGLATSIAGFAGTHYKIISPVVKIRGPRLRKMMYLFSRANRDAQARRMEDPDYRAFDFKKFHERTCNYDIPEKTWDHLDLFEAIGTLKR